MATEKAVGDVTREIINIENAAGHALQMLSGLDRNTELPNLDHILACLPFKFCLPVEPTADFDCFPNYVAGSPVTVNHLATTMWAVQMWMGDIRVYLERLPQDMGLPGAGLPNP